MRFLIDSMLPPQVVEHLQAAGHEATTPAGLGAHNFPDDMLIQLASSERLVIVTENASDFSHATTCVVVFVRKSWWSRVTLAASVAAALDRWAAAHPDPGPWPHWLDARYR